MNQVDVDLTNVGGSRSLSCGAIDSSELKSIRVLHVTAGNLFGGIETFLVTLARMSALEPMMQSAFAVCFPGRFRDELTATDLPVHDLRPVRLSRPWTVLRARRRLATLLDEIRPDRVVVHGAWTQVIFGPVVRRHRIPLVLLVHGPISKTSLLDRLAQRVPIDLMIVNSEHIGRESLGFYRDVPHELCRYPVASLHEHRRSRDDVRRESDTPLDAVVIVQVSRMESWKGQHVLIQALKRLKHIPEWRCWIVGGAQRPAEEDYARELIQLVESAGMTERIQFLGQRSDVVDLLQAADIFCQPNVGPEPFGIVFVEALYAGLYVATSDFGGGAEIIAPPCGSLTLPGDDVALAASLEEAIADPSRRRAAADAGPERAAALCDPQTQIHRLFEVLWRAIDRADMNSDQPSPRKVS